MVVILTRAGAVFALAALVLAGQPASSQVYTPQSPTRLSVTHQVQRLGGSRILILGEVRNSAPHAYDRVVVVAEGLDDSGRVVSRGRGYVPGGVPFKGAARFEIRLLGSGTERRFRVDIESFEEVAPGPQS
jgi:hypothetical protein